MIHLTKKLNKHFKTENEIPDPCDGYEYYLVALDQATAEEMERIKKKNDIYIIALLGEFSSIGVLIIDGCEEMTGDD